MYHYIIYIYNYIHSTNSTNNVLASKKEPLFLALTTRSTNTHPAVAHDLMGAYILAVLSGLAWPKVLVKLIYLRQSSWVGLKIHDLSKMVQSPAG